MNSSAAKHTWMEIRKLKNEPGLAIVIAAIVLITTYFVLWPILKVVSVPNLGDYEKLFTITRWTEAALNSLFMTVISTISCTVVAFIFAYTISRLDIPFKGLFKFITILPIVSPPFIVALSYILLFGRQGIVSKHILGVSIDVYGWHGLWLVQTINFFPFAYAVIYSVLKTSSTNLEYAAYNLGATRWQVFKDIFFPLCRPGVAGGALIAAMNILADFGNPMIIGGNFSLLPTEAYLQMSGWNDLNSAAMLSTTLLVPALALFILNRKWVGKRSYVTVTGKETSLKPYPVAGYVKWILFGFCSFVTIVILAVYGVLFYGAFTKTWGYDWTFTLKNLDYVFGKGTEIINSLKFAFFSSVGAAFLGIILAYIVQRKQIGINRLLDFLAILPGAVPGIFLGLGFAMAFNGEPLALTGTSAIMILALMFWNLPTCYSASLAGFQQIGSSLEEASTNLGIGSYGTFKMILLPLLRGPFMSSIITSFLRSITCLSVIVFIYSASTSVGTISILGLVGNGEWGRASAFTVVLISIAFAVLAISKLIFKDNDKSLNI
ncbi:iron(III) transport system permease protein [Paenibacillus sp. 1_12]|uniref:ABC transporter permease n=1 Tax=Paenibacillus sp. 1_12 TaxID=1566278 RepID=UPI0008F1B31D|nr:iron ABC transporter permease [Paenibacillus sp. 1_12]SFL23534.1 iron(III) transport system permease protein [Paenibacillus sp. 1_12]